jgi:hypothetical protein
MRHIAIAVLVIFVSCSKQKEIKSDFLPISRNKEIEKCSFGVKEFNLSKRASVADEEGSFSRGPKTGGSSIGGTTTPITESVILLDFNGQLVSGTSWNYNGPITCTPANLTSTDISRIVDHVSNDYSPFNVLVTTDETMYNAANPAKRIRVIITETWEWYGQAGGVSFIGSFTWGDNTPCFVFSSLLNYNTKQIAEAASHEAGHTFGLNHQASYDAGGVLVSEYNYGQGSGEIGWAPIMGCGYYQNLTIWHNGATKYGVNSIQDDVTIIRNVVGLKTDDYSNTSTGAAVLLASMDGIINSNTDIDFFSVSTSSAKTISAEPFNVGTNNLAGNVDLVIKVYNQQKVLISTTDNPLSLSSSVNLSAGQYYISVAAVPNSYASTYGMEGKYKVSLQ